MHIVEVVFYISEIAAGIASVHAWSVLRLKASVLSPFSFRLRIRAQTHALHVHAPLARAKHTVLKSLQAVAELRRELYSGIFESMR